MELIIVPTCKGYPGIKAALHVGAQLFAGMGTRSENAGYDYFTKVTYGLRITFAPL